MSKRYSFFHGGNIDLDIVIECEETLEKINDFFKNPSKMNEKKVIEKINKTLDKIEEWRQM